MAALLRLLPRYWDERRLLQFLTGLILLALTLGGPAAATTSTAASAATMRTSAAGTAGPKDAASTAAVPAGAVEKGTATSATTATVERPVECRHDASGVRRLIPTHSAGPVGVASGAHGSRAPPRA